MILQKRKRESSHKFVLFMDNLSAHRTKNVILTFYYANN